MGSIQIEGASRYIVKTASRSEQPLHKGKILIKEAPGGLVDWCLAQEERGVESMRTIWQSVLDQELTLLAQIAQVLRKCGCVGRSLKQFRVDGICAQGVKKSEKAYWP